MKLTDYKNEDALELLCDLLDPMSKIIGDQEVIKAMTSSKSKVDIVKIAISNHKDSVIEVLARLKGVPVSEYNGNLLTMTKEVFEILNDEEMLSFFSELGLARDNTSSTDVTETTKAKKK